MSGSNKYVHLTLAERQMILEGIRNESTKTAIAKNLGKDKSTIAKEIRLHRKIVYKCPFPRECTAYKKCRFGLICTPDCPDFVPFVCRRRDRTPGACDGCGRRRYCRFTKYSYDPVSAEKDYHSVLVDSRLGVSLTMDEAKKIAAVVRPLINQGQSPFVIVKEHPELGICEKTLYNYIEDGIFSSLPEDLRICAVDLRRTVSRRISKKDSQKYKKRHPRKYLEGRTYKDFCVFTQENPDIFVTQMDTVYNSEKGPFIQTFKFLKPGVLFGLYHESKTAGDMVEGLNTLYSILGPEVFHRYCSVLLTDRGSEFEEADAMEKTSDGLVRTRVFYCDPMQSGQKGSLENKHRELRYILPKGTDLHALGLVSQEKLNLVLSHVDSCRSEFLCGRSPMEMAQFLCPDLYDRLIRFGLQHIESDKVILKPYLLK